VINTSTKIIRLAFYAACLLLAFVVAAQAQATGGWTLNIDNTGYNPMQAGGLLPYAVRISNNDNVGLPSTTVTFDIPSTADFEGVTGLNNCVSIPSSGQPATVTCDVPALAPDAHVDATVNLRPMVEGTLSLKATIKSPGPSFSRQTIILKGVDLSVVLKMPATVQAGSIANFSATVSNAGPYAADGAHLSIPIPTGMSGNVTLPSGCSISSGSISCNIPGPIAVGDSVVLNFSDQVTTANASSITLRRRSAPRRRPSQIAATTTPLPP
jgi:hypothetical protein